MYMYISLYLYKYIPFTSRNRVRGENFRHAFPVPPYTYIYMYVCMYICIYIYMYIGIYVYICICIHTIYLSQAGNVSVAKTDGTPFRCPHRPRPRNLRVRGQTPSPSRRCL